jgi:peptide/nickel transport system substrate-binding protein
VRSALVVLAVLGTMACASPSDRPGGGTIVIATTGGYGSLFPPLGGSTTARQITELVYDYLTEVGLSLNTTDDRTFAPRLAESWEWGRDSLSLAVHLHPDAKWHDGVPVRASDVTYSYRLYSDSSFSSMASQLASIDSVTERDSLTVVFWFRARYPLQFYDATSQMQILPMHLYSGIGVDSLKDAVSHIEPVGTGRYRFVSERPGQSIEIAADSGNYRGAPKIRRVIWRFFGSADEAARALFAGEADVYDVMRPSDVQAAARTPSIKIVMSAGSDYAFMTFNLRRPLFASRELRRALAMAVDREAMVKNVFDSLASPGVGPTVRYFPTNSSALRQIPYDPARAGRILDSLGWRINSKTRIRARDNQELRFKVILPSSSSNRIRMATLLQEQLRRIGVAVELDQMEFTAFNSRLYRHDFDAALASWHLGTSPASVRMLWTSNASKNLGFYSNRAFDAQIDSAISTLAPRASRQAYNSAYQTAIDDAPAIWLYEPKLVIGIHKRIRTKPYRPDAWWWSLADWYIPPDEQIGRDRIE